ncbi:hypothetical protein Pcinc_020988 [Petrolisthes cinctipes]|uniref:Mediator complex subunit 15 KIX domain-containing protein n=1 Tax=Petrolisthes cinctipes TaxID=88211 RepID=A0AAE1KI98_PETCI|nr:hypothetical protein Pcinc_020988 [Petrolisthes cinctipes]
MSISQWLEKAEEGAEVLIIINADVLSHHATHTRRDTSANSSDDENDIDDDDHGHYHHHHHHDDDDGRLRVPKDEDDEVMMTKETMEEEEEEQEVQKPANFCVQGNPRLLLRLLHHTSPPASPRTLPQYLRDNVKQFILQQLQVSERRKHPDMLELVQKFITSLEDQVYCSVTTQEEYISKLATRLAAILAHLTTTRRFNSPPPHHHNTYTNNTTKTRLHHNNTTSSTTYLRQRHITSLVNPVPPPPPTTSADLHPVVTVSPYYYAECRSLPPT